MPIETAQTLLSFAITRCDSGDSGCLSGAPIRSLVHLVSHGLACVHAIANLHPITNNLALNWEQDYEC